MDIESMLFKYICNMTKHLLTKVNESIQIYTTMYQLAETVYTTKFIKTGIVTAEGAANPGVNSTYFLP